MSSRSQAVSVCLGESLLQGARAITPRIFPSRRRLRRPYSSQAIAIQNFSSACFLLMKMH